jgi:hypothetical protein
MVLIVKIAVNAFLVLGFTLLIARAVTGKK